MNSLRLAVVLGASTLGFGQDAVVEKSTIWMDTVKRGDMARAVRGIGVLTTNNIAEVRVPETQAELIRSGQAARLDTRNGVVGGKVVRVVPGVANGVVKVQVQVEGALPSGAVPGLNVDAIIEVEGLKDVVYVGRPVMGSAQSENVLFKLAADGQYLEKVTVQYGRAGAQTIEVLSGVRPGDQVVLSDTSAFATKGRVRLQ